ncbi:alpha/beta fold hydrolase [Saccharopolyspora sp. NPDC050389]|uniref:alpha/beta fold hydrolase n=1 Tax=Saccharopolyspora sp. NPDC050389 TaxID=3155516 RepID=UPI0033D3643E
MRKTIATVLGAGLLAVGTVHVASADPGPSWQDCGDGLQCGRIDVPVDWADPGGGRIGLGLAKLPAQDPANRKGTLLVNIGGPAQQISVLRQSKAAFADLTRWFDVVVSDPRGFEASAGVRCPDPMPMPENAEWVFPDQVTYDAYAAENRRFGTGCAEAAGPLAGKLNTWQVARDMDAIRTALGEEKLNYYGNSYGTVFGQAYAEFFPDRIGRMYLDSVMDHTNRSWPGWLLPRAKTMESNLDRFAGWCATEPKCALHGRDVLEVWDEVLARAERDPIPAPGAGPNATAGATLIASRANPGYEGRWPELAASLLEAHAGDATRFARTPTGGMDPALSRIMFCADFPYPTEYGEVKALETVLRSRTPRIGWATAWQMSYHCAGLPETTNFRPHPIRPRGLPPILVASGKYDSTTPPQDARRVTAQLDGARYLPAEGAHALYLSGHPCVRDRVHRYLTAGELPPEGAACGAASS